MVVAAGLRLSRGAVLAAAAISTLAWYTVFIPPRFAFHIGTVEDAMIFAAFFAVAMAMGHLTSQLRIKELNERTKERQTVALYQLVRQAGWRRISKADSKPPSVSSKRFSECAHRCCCGLPIKRSPTKCIRSVLVRSR
jgi:K+-sensing histidine kinase KdpD